VVRGLIWLSHADGIVIADSIFDLVVGVIMGFNKLGDSCEPYVEDGGLPEDCQTDGMRALFVIG
jgi:hypothetical protein